MSMEDRKISASRRRPRGVRLGDLLLERGLIDAQQLKSALAQQKSFGGHLGTHLLESGVIAEERLLEALGEQRSTSTVSPIDLRKIPPSVLKLVPPRLARRHLVIPFQLAGRTLHLAAAEPQSILLVEDEIRVFTSCMVRTHLALEFRVLEAIQRHYGGFDDDTRLAALMQRLSPPEEPIDDRSGVLVLDRDQLEPGLDDYQLQQAGELEPGAAIEGAVEVSELRAAPQADEAGLEVEAAPPASAAEITAKISVPPAVLGEEAEPAPVDEAAPAAPTSPPASELLASESPDAGDAAAQPDGVEDSLAAHRVEALEPTSRGLFSGLSALDASPESPGRGPERLTAADPKDRLEEAGQRLQQAEMHDDVADVLLSFCAPFFRRRLLIARRRGQLVGWSAEGEGIDELAFERLSIPDGQASVFTPLNSEGTLHMGLLPGHLIPDGLRSSLKGQAPKECVVLPVRLPGRVACYLWADNVDREVGAVPLAQLQRLTRKAALALEICVLRNRIRTT